MPESNPIRDLENFSTGGMPVNPLPPSEVRRLGDRRRTRRRSVAVVAASVAAAVAVAVPVALTQNDGEPEGTRYATQDATPTPSTSPSPAADDITFPGGGIQITGPQDAAALDGTTQAFKDFVTSQAEIVTDRGEAECPDAFHGLTVTKYNKAGYATGGVNDCGGHVALWVDGEYGWEEVLGAQEAFDCDALSYLGVPETFVGGCYSYEGAFGPDDVDGISLGMSEADVEAAGGRRTASPGGEACTGVLLPGQVQLGDRSDGTFSPSRGVVSIFARPGMKTPEGVGLGSSIDELRAAYPEATFQAGTPNSDESDAWTVRLGSDSLLVFVVGADEVTGLSLTRPDRSCLN